MCIYNTYILNNQDSTVRAYSTYIKPEDIDDMSFSEIAYDDSKENFIDTKVPKILKEYIDTYSTKSAWPKMNGSTIESYARKYANGTNSAFATININADCTNFVSQALYNGGLPITYITSDRTANGIVNSTARWFHFNNNGTSTGYSVSTSWIRVVELYDYLAPHYGVFETSSGNTMSPYLNRGFVLQGKPTIGKYAHSVIVTITNGNITYCAHSVSRKDAAIQNFYNSYSKFRVVQTY